MTAQNKAHLRPPLLSSLRISAAGKQKRCSVAGGVVVVGGLNVAALARDSPGQGRAGAGTHERLSLVEDTYSRG